MTTTHYEQFITLRALVTTLCEGLNALTDNSEHWSPKQMAAHAQNLRVVAEAEMHRIDLPLSEREAA